MFYSLHVCTFIISGILFLGSANNYDISLDTISQKDVELIDTNSQRIVDTSLSEDFNTDTSAHGIDLFEEKHYDIPEENYEENRDVIVDENSKKCQFCFNDLLAIVLQFIAVIVAVIALQKSKVQMKESNQQSERAYNAFLIDSNRQFEAQQLTINQQRETIKAIDEQFTKLRKLDNRKEVIHLFSKCYSSIGIIAFYVENHFWDILKDSEDFLRYKIDMIQPFVSDATALQIVLQNAENTDLKNALDLCVKLRELNVSTLKDMDDLRNNLKHISLEFEKEKQSI